MYAIVIGASAETVYAIRQAQRAGLTVLAFDGNDRAEGLRYADEAYAVDIRNPQKIYEIIDRKKISTDDMFVLPVPIGRYLISAGALNEHYRLVGPQRDTTEICTDKWLFHRTLNRKGLRAIGCALLKAGEAAKVPDKFPVIVKPRYGAGSRQVLKISNEPEWKLFADGMPYEEDFIIEDAVEGQEYGIDGMVTDGKFHLILMRKKVLTMPPYRQCVGYISVNAGHDSELYAKIEAFLSELTAAVKLDNGIIHADIMYDGAAPFVIEMAPRPSGHRLHDLFTPMVTGVDMISEYIHFVQNKPVEMNVKNADKVYMIRYFDLESEIRKISPRDYILEKYPLSKYECNLTQGEVRKIKDGHSLMDRGFFVCEGASEEHVCKAANDVLHEFV